MSISRANQITSESQYSLLLALLNQWHSVSELNRILANAGLPPDASKVIEQLKAKGWRFREVEQEEVSSHPLPALVKRYRLSRWQKARAHAFLREWKKATAEAI